VLSANGLGPRGQNHERDVPGVHRFAIEAGTWTTPSRFIAAHYEPPCRESPQVPSQDLGYPSREDPSQTCCPQNCTVLLSEK
jgi:hypothetical protein